MEENDYMKYSSADRLRYERNMSIFYNTLSLIMIFFFIYTSFDRHFIIVNDKNVTKFFDKLKL